MNTIQIGSTKIISYGKTIEQIKNELERDARISISGSSELLAETPDGDRVIISIRNGKLVAENRSRATNGKVPGLDELDAAMEAGYNERSRYDREFARMMDDEANDGLNPPAPYDASLRTRAKILAHEYPMAAVYLRADNYTLSENVHKYAAGKKAMDMILSGCSIAEAEAVLDNWLPKESYWD